MKYLLIILISFSALGKEFIPSRAYHYKRDLMRHAQYVYGINAPIAMFGAQIHKESTWNPNARSPFADGLTQFTPETVDFVSKKFPELIAAEPFDPIWAIQAMLLYDKWLKEQISFWPDGVGELTPCDHWSFVLSSYNGGYGWIIRDRRLTRENGYNHNIWFNNVELFTRRSAAATRENRNYPRRILGDLYQLYHKDGWGGPLTICGEK